MLLNDTELKQRVQRHCGQKIAKNEEPCESCKKKLAIAKSIERQKDQAWREHEARGFGYIVGIIFPPYGKLLKSNLVLKESIIRKFKYGLSTFDPSIVIQFNNLDELKEVLRKYRK